MTAFHRSPSFGSASQPGRPDACSTRRSAQRGVVLFVALLAIIAMSLAGVAFVRAVANDVAIGGNIAMRQHAILAASIAIEHDVAALFDTGAISATRSDDPAHNYFAARQAGEDRRGVPRPLQTIADHPANFPIIDAGGGITLRHMIERLCLLPGEATVDNCTLSPPSGGLSAGESVVPEPPRTPYYRLTVRADGPAGAAVFVQVMLSEEPTRNRISWRVLDE